MAISQLSLNTEAVSLAYSRALLFDKMKKKGDPANDNQSEISKKEASEQILPEEPPKEKPKPNTVPFKPGFVFEYQNNPETGNVSITINDNNKVRVDLKDDKNGDERKRSIRSLVMLGLGEINLDNFNSSLIEGKNNIDNIKNELSLMNLKPDIPFGLGDKSFYISSKNLLSAYRPMDIKG